MVLGYPSGVAIFMVFCKVSTQRISLSLKRGKVQLDAGISDHYVVTKRRANLFSAPHPRMQISLQYFVQRISGN